MDDQKTCVNGSRWQSANGFTLTELLYTVAILGMILGIALPAFSSLAESMHKRAAVDSLVTILAAARHHAVSSGSRVTVCRATEQLVCLDNKASGSLTWQRALIFIDADHNRLRDNNEESVKLYELPNQLKLIWNRGSALSYQPDGSVTGNSNGTFKFYTRDDTEACQVVISLAGRVRQSCN